jgi:deoxyribose-phosphate aldolase
MEAISRSASRLTYDGKDSAVSGTGFPNGADTIAVKRIDANTSTATGKKAGKVVYTRRLVVSKDGKIMTITAKGTDEQGHLTSSTSVWDKQ